MTKSNIKQILFTIILGIVAVFAYTNVSEAANCIHTYTAATCTKPKTCTSCGYTTGAALGHNYVTCGNTATCTKCGTTKTISNGSNSSSSSNTPSHVHTWTSATCLKPKTCTSCGETTGAALGHSFKVTSSTQATCTSGGKTISTCTRCGKTQTSTSSALGHDYKTTTTSATCTEAGKTVKTCSRCGDSKVISQTSALGHDYATTITPATCTNSGRKVEKCTRCGDSKTTTLTALSHDYKTTTTPATCTEAGKNVKTCSRCGDTQTTAIPALNHDYKTTTIPATCISSGKITKTCTRCGDTKVTSTSPTGHDFVTSTTTATCTVPGKTIKKCKVCGETVTIEGQPLGHDYVESSKTEPTCTENGKIVKTCTRCGDTQTTILPATGHKESIVFNTDYHWYECDNCSLETSDKEPHDFDKDNVCRVCGYHKGGNTPVDPEEPEDPDEPTIPDDDELIIEPWMKENDALDCLAVSLRSEPYEEDRANKNIYALNEKVIYYVDYKNGGKDTDKDVTLQLTLPLSFSVVSSDGAKVSKSNKTFTWTFDGMENDESGKSSITYKRITPKATIDLGKTQKDVSAVLNMVVKDFDEEINDEHEPYMYGDKDTKTFRPDDIIKRGEGALVLTRIFGISTIYDSNAYAFPDLNETYLEARKAVMAATAYGIIQGYPDGTYKPNKAMTRGEFITILARQIEEEFGEGFEIKDESALIKVYKDKTRIYYISDNEYYDAHWSISYATLLARLNMTPLTEDSTNLRVDDPITRAEVAQLVNFYLLRAPADVDSSTKTQFPDVSKRHKLFADIVEATRKAHTYSITEDGTEDEE